MSETPKDSLGSRVRREKIAHTGSDVLQESIRLKQRFHHILNYPSRQRLDKKIQEYLQNAEGKHILDLGCGRGDRSLVYLAQGARVSGIDISQTYIEYARDAADGEGFASGRFEFQVMDAHALEYEDDTFDLAVGYGILHHLEYGIALREVHRALRDGGHALFLEPLAGSPLLALFRAMTPNARTADERPFTRRDLRSITESGLWAMQASYCGIICAPVAVLTSLAIPSNPENFLIRIADGIESWVNERSWLSSWNQYVLLDLVKS